MSDQQKDEDIARVRKVVDDLAEHFDSVQIFVSRNTGEPNGNTRTYQYGTGNWYARYGQVKIWTERSEEFERAHERKQIKDDDGN